MAEETPEKAKGECKAQCQFFLLLNAMFSTASWLLEARSLAARLTLGENRALINVKA